MHQPSVSVAMCTYNGEAYVAEQLQSILDQTQAPDEVIVCDDCSTDRTVDEVRRVIHRTGAANVHLHLNPINLGYRKNFEQALQRSSCDIVFFSDQDDVWMERKIERFVEVFRAEPSVHVVYSDGVIFSESTSDTLLLSEWYGRRFCTDLEIDEVLIDMARSHHIRGCLLAVRSGMKAALPLGEGWAHDRWLTVIGHAMSAITSIDEPLIMHRRHENTFTKRNLFQKDRFSSVIRAERTAGHVLRDLVVGRGDRRLRVDKYPGMAALRERLEQMRTSWMASSTNVERLDAAVERCEGILSAHEARFHLRRRGPIGRALASTGHLFAGRYHEFDRGVLSYVDDMLLRPVEQS